MFKEQNEITKFLVLILNIDLINITTCTDSPPVLIPAGERGYKIM